MSTEKKTMGKKRERKNIMSKEKNKIGERWAQLKIFDLMIII